MICCEEMARYTGDMEDKPNVKLGPAIHHDKFGNFYFAHNWCIDWHPIKIYLKYCPFCGTKLSFIEPVTLPDNAFCSPLFSQSGELH